MRTYGWLASTVVVVTAVAGCGRALGPEDSTQPEAAASGHAHEQSGAPPSPGARRRLAQVKAEYQSFRDLGQASRSGWGAQITGCLADPTQGGMGFHYGNPNLIDGLVEYLRPEVFLYQPGANGEMRLVAIEYLVPFTAWTHPAPPELFGQKFQRNLAFQVWALHVWLYRENPSGLFANWNPLVSCPAGE